MYKICEWNPGPEASAFMDPRRTRVILGAVQLSKQLQ